MGEDLKKEEEESSADLSEEQASSHPAEELVTNKEKEDNAKNLENSDEDGNVNNIVEGLKEENQAMRRESREAKRESIALKSTLEQVIVAARQDIEMGEQDINVLREDYGMLKLRLKEEIRSNKSLERENENLKTKLVAAKAETEALHHEFKQMSRDHETQQARWSFDQAELEASKKHAKILEKEIQGLRTITQKFTESSTTHSLDFRSGLDALRKEKEMAEIEIEKVLDRNKNQTALLQRLEKRLHQVQSNSDAQIAQLQKQLNEERKKKIRFGKNGTHHAQFQVVGMGSPSGSLASRTGISPLRTSDRPDGPDLNEDDARVSEMPPATDLSRSSSGYRTDKMESTNMKYTNLRDLLHSERNLTQTLAEQNAWKQTSTIDSSSVADAATAPAVGVSGTAQASFLEAAIQKNNQNTGFWDKMFGGDQRDSSVASERISATAFLNDEIKEVVLENQRLEAEREKRIKERDKKAREEARVKLGKVKTVVKWGLLNMFSTDDGIDMGESSHHQRPQDESVSMTTSEAAVSHSPNQPRSPKESKEPTSSNRFEMTMENVDDIDLDTLRRLAIERTKGMTEEDLNKILEKRRSSRSSRMSATSDFSADEYAEEWDQEDEDEEFLT
jgi:regulator of replication initiation timing